MINVGLTGNRFSGKDTIAELFRKISIPVFEADIIVKFLMNHHFELNEKIKRSIDESFMIGDKFNAYKITGPVLDDMIDIIEPEIFKAYDKFKKKNFNTIYTVFHSSILFERDWHKKMDVNISVFSPLADRVKRCMEISDSNLDITRAYSLAQSEMSDLTKNNLSTYVIHNYNNLEIKSCGDLITQVNKIDQRIIDKYLQQQSTKLHDEKNSY